MNTEEFLKEIDAKLKKGKKKPLKKAVEAIEDTLIEMEKTIGGG
jgi:hypothetical protein